MFTNVFTLSTITTESHHRHGVSYLRVKIFKWEWCQPWLWYLSEMMWHSQSRAHSPSVSVTQINQNSLPGHSFAYKKPELPFFHHNRCFSNPPGEETPSFLSKTWMLSHSLTFCTFPFCIFQGNTFTLWLWKSLYFLSTRLEMYFIFSLFCLFGAKCGGINHLGMTIWVSCGRLPDFITNKVKSPLRVGQDAI